MGCIEIIVSELERLVDNQLGPLSFAGFWSSCKFNQPEAVFDNGSSDE